MTLDTFTSSKTSAMKQFRRFALKTNVSEKSLWDWVDMFENWKTSKNG